MLHPSAQADVGTIALSFPVIYYTPLNCWIHKSRSCITPLHPCVRDGYITLFHPSTKAEVAPRYYIVTSIKAEVTPYYCMPLQADVTPHCRIPLRRLQLHHTLHVSMKAVGITLLHLGYCLWKLKQHLVALCHIVCITHWELKPHHIVVSLYGCWS